MRIWTRYSGSGDDRLDSENIRWSETGGTDLSDMETVWNRLDEQRTEITRLRENHAGMESRLRALEDRTDRMLSTMSEARSESNHHFEQLYKRIEELDSHVQQARGGLRVGLWIAGAIGTFMGFLAAMAALAKDLIR